MRYLLALIVALAPSTASASTLHFLVTGNIQTIDTGLSAYFDVGDTFSIHFDLDTSAPPQDGYVTSYPDALSNFEVQISNWNVSNMVMESSTASIGDNADLRQGPGDPPLYRDYLYADGTFYPALDQALGGTFGLVRTVIEQDYSPDLFSGESILELTKLSAPAAVRFRFSPLFGGQAVFVHGVADAVTVVPEPTTGLLVGLGLVALGIARRQDVRRRSASSR